MKFKDSGKKHQEDGNNGPSFCEKKEFETRRMHTVPEQRSWEKSDHGMLRVGRDLKELIVPTPQPWEGTPPTRPLLGGLEHCRDWGIQSLSGQPVPVSLPSD